MVGFAEPRLDAHTREDWCLLGRRGGPVATPQNAYKVRKSSHGDVMLPVTVHLPNVKIGCQKLRGQKRTEMKYCTQLWSDVRLAAVDGIWGGAVLWKTPIRM